MLDFCYPYFLANFNRMLLRSLLVGAFSTVGLVAGLAPNLSLGSILIIGAAAYAQEFSNTDVVNYAKAVLEAEPLRQTALNDIKQTLPSGAVPQISCDEKETWSQLPENARNIASSYCNQYEGIVKKYFSSFNQFNQITKNVRNNPDFKKRIQDEMLRLQNSSSP